MSKQKTYIDIIIKSTPFVLQTKLAGKKPIKPEKSHNQETIIKRNWHFFKTTQYFSKKKALLGEQLRTRICTNFKQKRMKPLKR